MSEKSVQLERLALLKARGVRVERDWDEFISAANRLLSPYVKPNCEEIGTLFDQRKVLPLVAAARVLDMTAQHAPARDKSEREARRLLGLRAALAYALNGNFPSAGAVLRRTFPTLRPASPAQAALMAVALPAQLDEIRAHCPLDWTAIGFTSALHECLKGGEGADKVMRAFDACAPNANAPEAELWELGRLSLKAALHLSTAVVLKTQGAFSDDYIQRLASQVPVLMPPQYNLLKNGLLESQNAIVSLPPGTGKTLLGELNLMAALGEEPGLVVFLAPYVALGRQVARILKAHVPPRVRVHRWLGGHGIEEKLEPQTQQEILVATPERLDALLRIAPDIRTHLRLVVCDEAHLIGGDARGARLEGLLTRLRMSNIRLVLLSAALGEDDSLAAWLGARVFADEWRPTARRVALWTNDGRLSWRAGDDALRSENPGTQELGALHVPWPQPRVFPTERWPAVERQTPLMHYNAAYLAKHLAEQMGAPVLCICATRRGTRRMAEALAQIFSPREPHGALAQAVDIIEKRHRVLRPLAEMLRRGVAWHNSALPHDVRALVEQAIEEGEVEAVAATTTLAEGVDLPFRATILVDWLQWNDGGQRPLPASLIRNIAGRCGRAGAFTEGDTIFVDNPLGDLQFTDAAHRCALQEQLFFAASPEVPHSTFELLDENSPAQAAILRATFSSQFLAAMAEHPGEDVTEEFAKRLYVSRRGANAVVEQERKAILQELINGGFVEIDRWELSELGTAANSSELSPATCRRLLEVLGNLAGGALPVNLTDRIAFVGATLLRELGACPEQSHTDLKNVLTSGRCRFCVKPFDLELVLRAWLRGEAPESIFMALPWAQKSARSVRVDEWVEGDASSEANSAGWHQELDKFVDFTRHVLEVFLPWMLRACERLSPFADAADLLPWRLAAQYVEAGVDSQLALRLVAEGAPGTRQSLAALGRNSGDLDAALKEVGGKYCDAGKNLLEAWQWITERA